METQVDHLLQLKVMRLTKPALTNSENTILSEKSDLPQYSASEYENKNLLPKNNFLLLPQSFGNIYLGETFSSYICIINCTTHPVSTVSVKCDLQTNNSRVSIPIHVNKTIPTTIVQDETLDDVIHYEVKEIGTHILVCEVNYISPSGLPLSFRKFFKFQVLKPLDVQTKFYNGESEVFLEATIQNITAQTINLEKVDLEPSESYTVTALNQTTDGTSVFCSINKLQPQNSCQFLYCIKPLTALANDLKALKLATNIGKLDIVWRSSNFAERGRLQTSQLQRGTVEYGDLRLSISEAQSITEISKPFIFTCRVSNTSSSRSMELTLNFNTKRKHGNAYTGSSEQSLGLIEPEKFKDFKLTIFPTRLGIVSVSDLQLNDVFMKRSYEFEDILQIFVVNDLSEAFEMHKFVKYHDIPATARQAA